jgi:hypothetical protein
MNNPSYPDSSDNNRIDTASAVSSPEDQPVPVTAEDYVTICFQIWELRNDVNVLASLLGGMISRPQR